MAIRLTVNTNENVAFGIQEAAQVNLNAEASTYIDRSTVYTGAYEWTPSNETQTIEIAGAKAVDNITIKPIPNNYGLVTWDGSTITVS